MGGEELMAVRERVQPEKRNIVDMSWDPVTRIVGNLGIYTKIDFDNREVIECRSTSSIFRGYSVFMRGKDPRDAGFITSRICGICGDNHTVCSNYAQNMAFGITNPPLGEIIIKRAVPMNDDVFNFFYEALPGYHEVGLRRTLLGCWGAFQDPWICDHRYDHMEEWGRAMYVTPGIVVDGELVTTPYVKSTGSSVQINLPRSAQLPEMTLEWRIPRFGSNTIERDRARAYFIAYAAGIALFAVDRALAEIRKGQTRVFENFDVPDEAIGCGFHEAVRGVLSHHMVIRDGKIANYHPYPPTPWNASPRD